MQFLLQFNVVTVLLLTGLITAGYWTLGYDNGSAVVAKKNTLIKELKELEKQLQNAQSDIQQISVFSKDIKQLGQDVSTFLKYIPEDLTSAVLFEDITRLASISGLKVKILSNTGTRLFDFYEIINLKLSVEGSFKELLYFLASLTELNKVVTVNNLNIQDSRGKSSSSNRIKKNILKTSMDIKGYKYRKLDDSKK